MLILRQIHVWYRLELGVEEFGIIVSFIIEDRCLLLNIAFHHFATRLMIFTVHFDFHGAGRVVLFGLILKVRDEFFNTLCNGKDYDVGVPAGINGTCGHGVYDSNDFLMW